MTKITALSALNVAAINETISDPRVTTTKTTATFDMSPVEAIALVGKTIDALDGGNAHPRGSLHAVARKLENKAKAEGATTAEIVAEIKTLSGEALEAKVEQVATELADQINLINGLIDELSEPESGWNSMNDGIGDPEPEDEDAEEEPETEEPENLFELAIVRDRRGDEKVHAAGCKDVKREAKRTGNEPYFLSAATREAVARDWYGDVASDNHEEGTPEWEQEVMNCMEMAMTFLPCCAALPADEDVQDTHMVSVVDAAQMAPRNSNKD